MLGWPGLNIFVDVISVTNLTGRQASPFQYLRKYFCVEYKVKADVLTQGQMNDTKYNVYIYIF